MASGATASQYQPPSQQPEAGGEERDADDETDGDEILEEREAESSYEDEDE